ncbi:MAG: hypothetical protein IPP62_18600 [bacterium]|nr:hypothetical protein [bacterium]
MPIPQAPRCGEEVAQSFSKSMLTAAQVVVDVRDANRGLAWCSARPSCACATAGWTSSSRAYLDANCDNIHGVLLYLDFRRSQDEWERKRKAPTE